MAVNCLDSLVAKRLRPEFRWPTVMICVWASCRAYYFAFYVIQHYVDPSYRFSGLIDFFRYALSGRQSGDHANQGGQHGTHE